MKERLLLLLIKKVQIINEDKYLELFVQYWKNKGVQISGKPKYINNDVFFDGKDYSKIIIGDNVTISREVMFLTHDFSITTALESIGSKINKGNGEKYFLKEIIIGNNVFIGARSTILYGSEIGDNVIIGTGCVVKGKVPSNSIVIGNPCVIIGKTDEYARKHIQLEDFFTQ